MSTPPIIRLASPADADGASAVLREAATWLADREQALWSVETLDLPAMLRWIDEGSLHVAETGGVIVGTILIQATDELFWPDVPAGESLFVHKLAVVRSAAKTGLSRAMLDYAAGVAEARGKQYLRLDCAPRPALMRVYEAAGFVRVADRTFPKFASTRWQRELQQKGSTSAR